MSAAERVPVRVLVTDGDERSALAVVRALGRRGHRPFVLSGSGRSMAGASRHARADVAAPSPQAEPEAFAARVVAAARDVGADVVLPVGEASILATLAVRDRLAPACVPFPSLETFRAVCDKPRVLERARALGIAVPAQHVADSAAALRELAATALAYPLVAKPARSVAGGPAGLVKLRVRHAADAAALGRIA
ncbi:MAG TPA: hypothetical protein VFX50_08355, partial [Gemmatimonadales bacterium]|nr:hypothetical protein [Gemmatimonadales bacterium]